MKIILEKLCCTNPDCSHKNKFDAGNIVKHSYYKTKHGRRRRFSCKICRKTFCSTHGTSYYRLHKSKKDFDEVAAMSVEGINQSSISRIKGLSRTTVYNWLIKASLRAFSFNQKHLRGYELKELQFDERKSFIRNKKNETWIFMSIEVCVIIIS